MLIKYYQWCYALRLREVWTNFGDGRTLRHGEEMDRSRGEHRSGRLRCHGRMRRRCLGLAGKEPQAGYRWISGLTSQ